ncbi:DNA repair protein [Roseovarius sp. EL26]|uniref:DNA repair protein n=1 Tax=Roseovarius sp. EL26 TaxID=2126672 RepID=UPI000EA0581E|nr:DNA repair protein [Roseovarius sp. EL26]
MNNNQSIQPTLFYIQQIFQRVAFLALILISGILLGSSAMAAAGFLPWLSFEMSYGTLTIENAGMYMQIGAANFTLLLCFFLPTNTRVMKLENSHRSFTIGMQDVAQAYALAHASDRANLFSLSSEFDAVRERMKFLRAHPDLQHLEPGALEAAAQMSHVSQELADTYSDENVARAQTFLTQRQQEMDTFNTRLEHAKQISGDLKHWLHEVEMEESIAASQLNRLQDELNEVLPKLKRAVKARSDGTVIKIPRHAAE